eukprot:c27832_g1_i1 orf=732-2291(+)
MTEVLPSWSYPSEAAGLNGRAYPHRCSRSNSFESYTQASPLMTGSFQLEDDDAGRRSEGVSSVVDFEDHISRRDLRDRIQALDARNIRSRQEEQSAQLSMLALLLAAFRRSLMPCKTARKDISMDIGWPTNVRHVTHVTFDRFNGFLGLPVEFEIEIPRRVPSASASVFGVSAESMQCSYDRRGNSVPTILLLIQERLYGQAGLKAEGIFRINAENSHEEEVREQLNKGIVPDGVDLHCLAGLIKAWFRELPKGVLDSLAPEQIMQCTTEEQSLELVKQLPSTEGALLDWAVNLMADVVQEEESNKMDARNIAMVFAPNMTQMVDPLTALMHVVQVMNFLKTLILTTLRERQEAALDPRPVFTCADSPFNDDFDTDSGSQYLPGYSEQDSLEDDFVRDALMPPFNSPNICSSDEDCSMDDLNEFIFDFNEKISTGERASQGEQLIFDGLVSKSVLKDFKVESRDNEHYTLVYPEDIRDQARLQGMKIIDEPHCKLGEKALDKYCRIQRQGLGIGNLLSW